MLLPHPFPSNNPPLSTPPFPQGSKRKKEPASYTKEDFETLEVGMLREMLRLQFKPLRFHDTFGPRFDLERVIDDFVLLCMFVGNDFLPHLPHLDIADGALNMMMAVYREAVPNLLGGYITDKAKVMKREGGAPFHPPTDCSTEG